MINLFRSGPYVRYCACTHLCMLLRLSYHGRIVSSPGVRNYNLIRLRAITALNIIDSDTMPRHTGSASTLVGQITADSKDRECI